MSAASDRPPDDRWVHGYRAIGDDEFPDIGRVHEVPIVPFTDSDPFPFDRPIAAIVELPHEILEITELSPYDGTLRRQTNPARRQHRAISNGYALASDGGADSGHHPGAVRLPGAGAEAQYLPDQGRAGRPGAGENAASESRRRSRRPRLYRRTDQVAVLRHRRRDRQLAGRSGSRASSASLRSLASPLLRLRSSGSSRPATASKWRPSRSETKSSSAGPAASATTR